MGRPKLRTTERIAAQQATNWHRVMRYHENLDAAHYKIEETRENLNNCDGGPDYYVSMIRGWKKYLMDLDKLRVRAQAFVNMLEEHSKRPGK